MLARGSHKYGVSASQNMACNLHVTSKENNPSCKCLLQSASLGRRRIHSLPQEDLYGSEIRAAAKYVFDNRKWLPQMVWMDTAPTHGTKSGGNGGPCVAPKLDGSGKNVRPSRFLCKCASHHMRHRNSAAQQSTTRKYVMRSWAAVGAVQSIVCSQSAETPMNMPTLAPLFPSSSPAHFTCTRLNACSICTQLLSAVYLPYTAICSLTHAYLVGATFVSGSHYHWNLLQ